MAHKFISDEAPTFCRCGMELIEEDRTPREERDSFTGKQYVWKVRK